MNHLRHLLCIPSLSICFEFTQKDATKLLFLAFFYNTVFPLGFFLASIALMVYYCIDKFCLLRVWRPVGFVGTSISRFSRKYFFSTAFFCFCMMTTFWWSGYPYDKLCKCNSNSENMCNRRFESGTYFDNNNDIFSVTETTDHYYYCNQNFFSKNDFPYLISSFG